MPLWNHKNAIHGGALQGCVRAGRSTKKLLQDLEPRQIIVIDHADLDDMAVQGILEAKVKAVVNAGAFISGRYPLDGPAALIRSGVPLFEIEPEHFDAFSDGVSVSIDGDRIQVGDRTEPVPCSPFTLERAREMNERADQNLENELKAFVDNTLHYAQKEKDAIIRPLSIPFLKTDMAGRHAVVVVRGTGYKQDLMALKDYIEDYRPVLIGVDGGADALMEYGYLPDLIVGDMDSISDRALLAGAEVVVHAYPDGRAPGWQRVEALGIPAHKLPAPGTSEDIAMLIAYELQAELIVTLGTHSNMIDFLQKGRSGMASTMLVRLKIGPKMIDAKGVSKLYHRPVKLRHLWLVPVAALFPLAMLSLFHPGLRHLIDVVWMYMRLSMS